jgi:hypothetical protein
MEQAGFNCFAYFCVKKWCRELKTFKPIYCFDVRSAWVPNCAIADILIIKINRNMLMKDTHVFVDRLVKEYNEYFPEPDSDMVLMMLVHPLMVWGGYW